MISVELGTYFLYNVGSSTVRQKRATGDNERLFPSPLEKRRPIIADSCLLVFPYPSTGEKVERRTVGVELDHVFVESTVAPPD